jgi:hypothetical protein
VVTARVADGTPAYLPAKTLSFPSSRMPADHEAISIWLKIVIRILLPQLPAKELRDLLNNKADDVYFFNLPI